MTETTGAASAAPSSGASPAATDTATPVVSTPASATATPTVTSETTAAPASPVSTGEPPKERWADILEHTRTKTKSEVEAEYRTKYGWVDEFQGNPYPYLEQWLDQVSAHPEMGPKLLAKAARMLQSRRGQTPPAVAEEPAPDVPIQDGQGNVVSQTYSAAQLKKWQEWNWAQRETALGERFSPLEQKFEKLEQAERQSQIAAQSQQQTQTLLTEMRQDPHFKEHEPAIKQALIDHPEWGANLDRAFHHVLRTHVLPTLSQKEQAKVLDHLQTQANGASVHPSGSQVSGPPKFKSFKEASEYYAKHPDEAERMANR